MGFKDVKSSAPKATGEPVKLTGLEVGGSCTGYVIRFVPSKHNPDTMNILMQAENSDEKFYVYTSGNMKYLIGDGVIKQGLLTKIVRLENKNVKGKMSSQFQVLQDPEQTIEVDSFDSIPSATVQADRTSREVSAVKAQAAKLTNAMKPQAR